jgi:TatD DNase family protein
MLVDSHCHIDFPELVGQLDAVFALMRENDVAHALCVSVTIEDFPRVRGLAESHEHVYASVGVHPDHDAGQEPTADRLVALAQHAKVVAIGETGLDYYRLKGDLEWQRERFRTHIRAARACGKPLIIHTRDAAVDTLRVMREEGADRTSGVMHCFTGDWQTAQSAMDMGFYISFSGIVTFKNAKALKEVARRVPLERLLIETDAPYLAPVPHRGKTNQPGYVRHVAEEMVRLKQAPFEQIAEITTANFFKLFKVQKAS